MIGSATKPLTTLMISRLIDQNKLSWATPIVELLSDFVLEDLNLTRRIQIEHAASHSTGMPRRDWEFIFTHSGISAEERLAQLKNQRATAEPGAKFQYSNTLFSAGGYAAARAFIANGPLEAAFESAITDLVFRPLEMNDTFLRPELATQSRAASPHAINWEGGVSAIPLPLEKVCYNGMAPAGAVWSTAPDLARYLLLELGKGCMPGGTQLISEQTLLERRREGVTIAEGLSYGLGLMVSKEQGFRVIFHGGNTMGFSTELYFLPEADFGFVVLTNLRSATHLLQAIRQKLFELALGAEPRAEESLQAAMQRRAWMIRANSSITTDPALMTWLDPLMGIYRSEELGPIHLLKNGGRYRIQCAEWESGLGSAIRWDGACLLYQTTPPWCESRVFVVENGDMILDAGEIRYVFRKLL